MADGRHDPRIGDGPEVEPERGPTTGPPRWVKVFGVVVGVLVLLVVVLQVVGGGGHGPGRHTSSGAAGTPPWATTEAYALSRTEPAPFQAFDG